jgi:hypothetical protein
MSRFFKALCSLCHGTSVARICTSADWMSHVHVAAYVTYCWACLLVAARIQASTIFQGYKCKQSGS